MWCDGSLIVLALFFTRLFLTPFSFTPFYLKPWLLFAHHTFLSLLRGASYVGISIAWGERCQILGPGRGGKGARGGWVPRGVWSFKVSIYFV